MKNFDVIIIGGGPAGAMCGIELQKKGIKSCIIDKSLFPRDKLCGGLLTQKSVDLINKHCPEIENNDFIINKTNQIDFYIDSTKISRFNTTTPYYFTERKTFDDLLIQYYKKLGGYIIENHRVSKDDINFDLNTIKIDSENINYTFLIGADGCNSVVSRSVKIKRFDSFCLEGEISKDRIEDNDFRIYFGCAKNGYGWYFPKNNYYSIGIGGDNKNKAINEQAKSFFKTASSKEVTNIKGAFVPSGHSLNYSKLKNNTLLVGDAAGFIDPITREGIYYALLSGIYAAEAISETIISKTNSLKKRYLKKTKHIIRNIKYGYFFQKILFYPIILNTFLGLINKHKSFALYYFENVMLTNKHNYINFLALYFIKYRNKNN